MPLVTSTEMFKKAYDGGYAIGAFNVNNMEIVQGITEACREEKAPVILQVSKGARAYANHTYLVKLVEAAVAECPEIPIVLHLDFITYCLSISTGEPVLLSSLHDFLDTRNPLAAELCACRKRSILENSKTYLISRIYSSIVLLC